MKFKTSDFNYFLPDKLIAKYPLEKRSASRLLVLDRRTQKIMNRQFSDFVNLLSNKDFIIFNDTKVIPARLFGEKTSGGKVECLVERILTSKTLLAQLRSSKSPKKEAELLFSNKIRARVLGREGDLFELEFLNDGSVINLLEKYGEMPIPPYLERHASQIDRERYQTIFAAREGAVAAPTASLHFDEMTMDAIKQKGIETGWVTLHVGAGTFQPVRSDDLSEHVMHKEYLEVSETLCSQIKQCKARGGRVIAIGTTVVRCLETAVQKGSLQPFQGDTNLFIYPGFSFKVVDVLLTNFHLPKSTLLMLVCALGGFDFVMQAYKQAVEAEYRFFSYGDAMLVL